MNPFRSALAGVTLVSALATAPVLAAEVAPVVIPMTPTPAPALDDQAFGWNGVYVGALYAPVFYEGVYAWSVPSVQIGYNLTFGRLLIGGSTKIGAYLDSGSSGLLLQVEGRAGIAFDRVAVYGLLGGLAYGPAPLSWYAVGGGGIEVALGRRFSVFGEIRLEEVFSPPFYIHGVVGLNWNFGN